MSLPSVTSVPQVCRTVHAAVDIGASSGRVVAGVVTDGQIELHTVHRFANGAVRADGRLRWNLRGLFAEVLTGMTRLGERYGEVTSIGVDTWAVDYGLLDADGRLLAEPTAYRDDRTTPAVLAGVHARVGAEELYAVNGLQSLPFTTIYQLAAEQQDALWPRVRHAVLLPDLLGYWLTGELRTEVTNASTTGLLDARTRTFSADLARRLDLPPHLFPPLVQPGERLGTLLPEVARTTGLAAGTTVVAVGSHDTASAVVGVPATEARWAYVSSGTWSLVGLELEAPVLTAESRAANFTNEGGVDGRTRFLRNVGGLWLLSESLRDWAEHGEPPELEPLLAAAAALPSGGPRVDVDDDAFIAPGGMPERIRQACRTSGQAVPRTQAELVRCVLESLAAAYARTLDQAERLTGRSVEVVHVVGGGAQNTLLCQLAADACRRTVLAGPVEATALGNVMVQARTAGSSTGTLEELRAATAARLDLRRYEPQTEQKEATP
jgi:rhamnulokinase